MLDLKEAMRSKVTLMVAGAYDGLSARLVERAGFDAIWASGFCISAAKALPDRNVVSTTELIDKVGEITSAVSIPTIVDCDEGYGALPTTRRLVRELAIQGVQGICLEDNSYPKSNSFWEGAKSPLLRVEAFCEKIQAIKQTEPNLLVIARTESLILNLGLEHAIERSVAYVESGADLILIHSKYNDLSQYQELARAWPGLRPLIVIPTMAPSVSFRDLASLDFKMVIYANQALRASVRCLEEILSNLREIGAPAVLVDRMVSVDHVFQLTDIEEACTQAPSSALASHLSRA